MRCGLLGGHAELATIEVDWAVWRLNAGRSPEHPLAIARRRLAVARTAQPDSPAADLVAALADVVEGRWRTARGQSPRALYERALTRAAAVHSLRPNDGEALAALAQVRLWRARAATGDDTRRSEAAAGLTIATAAVVIDPNDAGARGRQAALASLAGDDTLEDARIRAGLK